MKIAIWLLIASCVAVTTGCARHEEAAKGILFDQKTYFESAIEPATVYVSGSLTGDGVGYPNNSVSITCYKDRKECLIYSVEQIGENQVGGLQMPLPYEVTEWDAQEIVMTGSDLRGCRKETISIVRKSESVVWVQEPINQSQASCKDSDTRLYKWSVEDPPFWKSMKAKKQ